MAMAVQCHGVPGVEIRRASSGRRSTCSPTTKKRRAAPAAASISSIAGVPSGWGPSSNVIATAAGKPSPPDWPASCQRSRKLQRRALTRGAGGERVAEHGHDDVSHGAAADWCQFRHIGCCAATALSSIVRHWQRRFDADVTIRRRVLPTTDNGFAVLDADAGDSRSCWSGRWRTSRSGSGPMSIGRLWCHDSRYGEQVKVSRAQPLPPPTGTRCARICDGCATSGARAKR